MYVVTCRLRVLTTQLKAFRIELLAFVLFLKNSMASDRPLWVVLLRRTTTVFSATRRMLASIKAINARFM